MKAAPVKVAAPKKAIATKPAPALKANAQALAPPPVSAPLGAAPAKAPGNDVTRRHGRGSSRMRSTLSQEYESLAPYVKIAQRHPPLSREFEYDYSNRARAGDARARQLLINHNVAFVLSMCRRYQGKGCRMDDLVQEGMIGLLKAVEHFDASKGNRFSTYASWWIRAYVQKFLRDMRATVKPIIAPPGEERRALPRDFSLDAPIGDDDDTTWLDRLEDVDPSPDAQVARQEYSTEVRDALERVKKRIGGLGWDIVEQRLESDDPRTLEEIGKEWGLSRERVRQVEKSTKAFLERYLDKYAA